MDVQHSFLSRLKEWFRPSGAAHKKRILRRISIMNLIARRLKLIKIVLLFLGYSWMILIPMLEEPTYVDENALQPYQVNTDWSWNDVHVADLYLTQLEELRDGNYTSEQRAQWLSKAFKKLGILSSSQTYSFSTSMSTANGTNAYAVISSPRHSGTEAMVICSSWMSRVGTVNIRGISTLLALAGFLKRYSYWGKDIVLIVSDGYLEGMQAWLGSYHGISQPGLNAEALKLTSGVIWTALNIDYPGHSFSHLGIFFEGLNGRLPNQDLLNSIDRIGRYYAGVPVILYDDIVQEQSARMNLGILQLLGDIFNIKAYAFQAKNIMRHVAFQYNGRGSGVHGLFHRFRIDAVTLFAVPATGPHGFHSIGRIIESTLRSMNNLLERLHASFFFYLLTGPEQFLKIGFFLPSAILVSVAIMFHGLSTWVDAAWIQDNTESEKFGGVESSFPRPLKWTSRRRSVTDVLCIMIITHFLGGMLFFSISRTQFLNHYKVCSLLLFTSFAFLPPICARIPKNDLKSAPTSLVLKALNLCLASTVISITSVLNFSLAACLSILFGIPLIAPSPSSVHLRLLTHFGYSILGLGWLLFGQDEVKKAIWSWQVLSVWFAPFVCCVYFPLILQADISLFV